MSLDTNARPDSAELTDGLDTDSSESSGTPAGGRVQLALNVRDIDAAVEFYSKLFGAVPAKRRPGYANFAVDAPPLKLVLIEDPDARGNGVTGALNHLGVEVASSAEVGAATQRLTGQGLATLTQDATSCCYAVQDKVWVHDPDGAPWEVYTVLADAPGDTSLSGSSCTTVDGQCVPTESADNTAADVELTVHGVPLTRTSAAAAPAAAPTADAVTAAAESACCNSGTAASCCDTSAKDSCCGDTAAGLPSTCGCA